MATDSIKDKYHFFWKDGTVFSQWHLADYTHNGIKFNCCEQGMMYEKAILLHLCTFKTPTF